MPNSPSEYFLQEFTFMIIVLFIEHLSYVVDKVRIFFNSFNKGCLQEMVVDVELQCNKISWAIDGTDDTQWVIRSCSVRCNWRIVIMEPWFVYFRNAFPVGPEQQLAINAKHGFESGVIDIGGDYLIVVPLMVTLVVGP